MDKYKKMARTMLIIFTSLFLILFSIYLYIGDTLIGYIFAFLSLPCFFILWYAAIVYFGYKNVTLPSKFKDIDGKTIDENDLLLINKNHVYHVLRKDDDYHAKPITENLTGIIDLSQLPPEESKIIGHSYNKGNYNL